MAVVLRAVWLRGIRGWRRLAGIEQVESLYPDLIIVGLGLSGFVADKLFARIKPIPGLRLFLRLLTRLSLQTTLSSSALLRLALRR